MILNKSVSKDSTPVTLADEHWKWVQGVFDSAGVDMLSLNVVGYLYKTAMIHGYKHAIEDHVISKEYIIKSLENSNDTR